MIHRALAALALGGSLFILLPGFFLPLHAQQFTTTSPELITRYRQILATDQGNLTFHYLLGVALLQDNQNDAALAELQTAYPAYQESVEAHYNLAIAALRLGDLLSAEIYLELVEALGADDNWGIYPVADLYFNMALKSQEGGNANEAIRYFHKVLSLEAKRYEVYRQLGDLYAHRGDTELAIKSFRTYLQKFPEDPVSRDYLFALEFNRAQDLLAADDLANSAMGFSAALETQPDSPTALYYLGYIAYAQHHPEQAGLLLNKAYAVADESLQQTIRPLLYNSALTLRKDGKYQTALDAISILADRKSASFNEVLLAGTLNLDLGNHRVAHEYLLRAVALSPNDLGANQNLLAAELGAFNEWLSLARRQLRTEELDEAKTSLQKAHKLQSQNTKLASLKRQIDQARLSKASVSFFNAQTALDAGDFTTAFDQVKTGLSIQPDNADGIVLRDEINTALSVDLDKILAKADQAREAESWAKAAEAYAQVLAVAPQHPAALAGRDQTITAQHQQSMALLAQGQKDLDAGLIDQATSAFNQILALEPDQQQAQDGLSSANQMLANRRNEFLVKGRQALGRSHLLEARQWFNKALSVDNSSQTRQEITRLEEQILRKADVLAAQAEQASSKNKYKQAKQLFAQALALVPAHKTSLAGRQSLAAKTDEAIKSQLQQASEAQQRADYSTATTAYRTILDIAPDNREALAGLEKSRREQTEELNVLVKQGQQALDDGEWVKAEEYLSKALQQDAYHKEAQQLRQRLEQVQQTGAQPGDEQKLYLQGVTYYTQGKYAEAIKSWQTVLILNPEHEKSNQNIAKTKRKMHQIEEYRGN